jgi:hypothetical protein
MNKLYDAATEALAALRRVRPQVRGALPEQDCDSAILALEEALADDRITQYYRDKKQHGQPPPQA